MLYFSDEGLSIFSQDQELTLHNNPSVSHPPWTGEFYDIQSQSSVLKWTQFPTSSNTMQTTQLSADMSLFSYLMTEQGSVTQNMATIQQPSPYSSGLNQAAMSQPNASVDQLVTSGQFQLESSLPTSTFEASSVMSTPALSSEFGLFTGTLQTPTLSDITDETFSAEFQLKSSEFLSLMETSFKSLQPSLQSKPGTGFHTASGREVTFVESQQTGTLTSVTSLSSALFPAEDPQTFSVHSSVLTYQSFDELTPVKSTHERMSFMLSLTQTLMQTPQTEEFQNIHSSHVFSSPETAGFIYPHAASTQPDQTMSPLSQLSTSKNNIMSQSGDYPGPTAPSTAQEPYITPSAYLMQSLGPSFPVCDQGKVHISGCSSFIYSTEKLRHTVDHSYLPPTENLTSFTSQFLRFDSSGRVVPTVTSVTSVDYVSFLFTNVYKHSSFSILTHTPSLDVDLSTTGGQSSARPLRSSAYSPGKSVQDTSVSMNQPNNNLNIHSVLHFRVSEFSTNRSANSAVLGGHCRFPISLLGSTGNIFGSGRWNGRCSFLKDPFETGTSPECGFVVGLRWSGASWDSSGAGPAVCSSAPPPGGPGPTGPERFAAIYCGSQTQECGALSLLHPDGTTQPPLGAPSSPPCGAHVKQTVPLLRQLWQQPPPFACFHHAGVHGGVLV